MTNFKLLHSKLSMNQGCRHFTRAWVLDRNEARRRGLWHRHAAVRMQARRQNAFSAKHKM